jgi:hypothetical protein
MLTDRKLASRPPAKRPARRGGLLLLATTIAMLAVPAFASATTIGTPISGIIPRATLDVRVGFSLTEVGQPATVAGGVSVFNFYAQATGTISFFITDSTGTVKYVTPDIAVTSTGVKSYDIGATQSVPINVGDEIGFYVPPGSEIIPFDQPGPNTSSTADHSAKPTVGTTLVYPSTGLARVYSLGATGVTTATTVASSVNPSQSTQPVTFTASSNGTSSGMGNPTGTVKFTADGASIGCDAQPIIATIRPWTATCTTSALTVGSHQIVATYSGGPSTCCGPADPYEIERSTSPAITQVVLNTAFGPSGIVQAPPTKTCVSKRSFTIHIRRVGGLAYRLVTVHVTGHPLQVLQGRRISAPVDLRGLPRGTFVVKIRVLTTKGRTLTGTRTYHTCRSTPLPRQQHPL